MRWEILKKIIELRGVKKSKFCDICEEITLDLEKGNMVIIDFKGMDVVGATDIDLIFGEVLKKMSYDKVKNRYGFKNATPKIRSLIKATLIVILKAGG